MVIASPGKWPSPPHLEPLNEYFILAIFPYVVKVRGFIAS